jgi:hypothetical protein
LRRFPLSLRKILLARRPDGIFGAPFEQGEIGLTCFALPWQRPSRSFIP